MQLLFPDEGLEEQLTRILNGTVRYHLFTNNIVPDADTVEADLTEAAWTGYASQALTFADYPISGVAAHKGYAIGTPLEFDNTSGGTVNPYGYYVTDGSSTMLLAIARFDGAPTPILDGGSLNVIPVWGDVQA